MTVRILTQQDFPKIKKLEKNFDKLRTVYIKNSDRLEAVEIFNKDGVFRGFGKDTKKAFKKAVKVLKKHYKN